MTAITQNKYDNKRRGSFATTVILVSVAFALVMAIMVLGNVIVTSVFGIEHIMPMVEIITMVAYVLVCSSLAIIIVFSFVNAVVKQLIGDEMSIAV